MVGRTVSHYRIVAQVGEGGMGVVYQAEDARLGRKAALKFLSPSFVADPQARARFLREAQTEGFLDHPNIATIYEIGDWEQQLFIAMAFYEGDTLRQRIDRGPMPVAEVASVLLRVATGLAAAHRAGIVHRDLKPANVMLTKDGQVKILDFGLARMVGDTAQTAMEITRTGGLLGTVAYMAPEQARGEAVDASADVWALGAMAYEMLAGKAPFEGDSTTAVLLSIVGDAPADLRKLPPGVPDQLVGIIEECLEKPRERRVITADDIVGRLSTLQASVEVSTLRAVSEARRRRARRAWVAAALMVLLPLVGALGWYVYRASRARWAREKALPEIERLVSEEQFVAAFRLADEARREIPTDPVWARLDPLVSGLASVTTTPPGARVYYREYAAAADEWTYLGESPVTKARMPKGFFAWKIEKPGLATSYDTTQVITTPQLKFALQDPGAVPPGMVNVTAPPRPYTVRLAGVDNAPPVTLHDFWIDRYEVTNRQFKQFIDAGGYRNSAFWRHPFVRNGQTLTFEQAMRLLTDSTGRPGPATWDSGSYAEGQDDFPVGGVSWYEAAAYAAYAGKSLPTIYHWGYVASNAYSQFYVPRSNFGGKGPMAVGASGGMNRFGAFDMAGNVKEWCWNSADASKHYILGGAWEEPVYMFLDADAQAPFDRKADYGFRCVRYSPDEPPTVAGAGAVSIQKRDYSTERPVGDAVFDAYRRLYVYDRIDLKPVLESADDTSGEWRRENVSFSAGYGDERLPAAVFLPKAGHPPYQAVVYFPGSAALRTPSSRDLMVSRFDWVMKSGRAAIHPVFKSTYERRDALKSDTAEPTVAYRDHVIAWAREVSRAVDYLQTRRDIAADRIAFVGDSWGAYIGPIVVGLEPRFRACVIVSGGLDESRPFPEVDPFNFAPRVKIPVLLLGGRYDFVSPADSLQVILFRLFATPNDQKRQVIFESGHLIPRAGMVRESLDWLDRYLGPTR